MMPRLQQLEQAEQDMKVGLDKVQARLEKMGKDAELLWCSKCGNKVPRSLMHDRDACFFMTHSGTYQPQSQFQGKWSCCEALWEDSKGCRLTRSQHVFT
jgi:hypothetical protein